MKRTENIKFGSFHLKQENISFLKESILLFNHIYFFLLSFLFVFENN